MKKYAYLARLEELLAALPAQERQDALNYYEEYFDAAGNDQEEKTAEELGTPEEVARKILEGEGLAQEEAPAQPTVAEPASPAPDSEPVTPPVGPEPPRLDEPEPYPSSGTVEEKQPHKHTTRRIWLIFWLVVGLALVVQVSVLLFGLGGVGGSSASAVAASEAVSYGSETEVTPQPTGSLAAEGPVIYSGSLDAPGKGTLFVTLTRGNVVIRSGDQATAEVRNVDVNSTVNYEKTVDYGYSFVCDSTDPNTHVTITLPENAFDRVEVTVSNSGAIELGDLQIREIRASTASGPVQSGQLRTEKLDLSTQIGNIWLEKVSDGVKYQVSEVSLQAPSGYVAANFSAPRNQWKTDITTPQGMTQTQENNVESTKYGRTLQVVAGNKVKLQYGIK